MLSGGVSSWMAGKRAVANDEPAVCLFTDTNYEDQDTYDFLHLSALDIERPLVKLDNGGKDIWDVFYETRMLGSTQRDPCSRVLKREASRKWVDEHYPDATIVVGIGWDEIHRIESIQRRWAPHPVEAPLTEPPYLDKAQLLKEAEGAGLPIPELYRRGAPHANCGGGCVKAGMAHWAWLLREFPERYAEWERKEQEFRAWIGKDVSMVRDRSGGTVTALPLKDLRERIEGGLMDDQMTLDWGGCACFA